jgi:hypothetical protein
MVESRHAVPFADPILSSDLACLRIGSRFSNRFDGRRDGLDTPVEGARVESFDRGRERLQVRGKFVRLFDAVACKGWVRGDAGGGWDGR